MYRQLSGTEGGLACTRKMGHFTDMNFTASPALSSIMLGSCFVGYMFGQWYLKDCALGLESCTPSAIGYSVLDMLMAVMKKGLERVSSCQA